MTNAHSTVAHPPTIAQPTLAHHLLLLTTNAHLGVTIAHPIFAHPTVAHPMCDICPPDSCSPNVRHLPTRHLLTLCATFSHLSKYATFAHHLIINELMTKEPKDSTFNLTQVKIFRYYLPCKRGMMWADLKEWPSTLTIIMFWPNSYTEFPCVPNFLRNGFPYISNSVDQNPYGHSLLSCSPIEP